MNDQRGVHDATGSTSWRTGDSPEIDAVATASSRSAVDVGPSALAGPQPSSQPSSQASSVDDAKGAAADAAQEAREGAKAVAGTAREGAKEVAGTAREGAGQTAEVAKDKARETVAEARTQARELYAQTRDEVAFQASSQQQRLAAGLRSVSDELASMAHASQEQGLASEVVRQVGDYAGRIGDWLEDWEPADVIEEIGRYARRHPATFLAISAGLGLLVGRLARGLKDAETPGSSAVSESAGSALGSATFGGSAPGSATFGGSAPGSATFGSSAPGAATFGSPEPTWSTGQGARSAGEDR